MIRLQNVSTTTGVAAFTGPGLYYGTRCRASGTVDVYDGVDENGTLIDSLRAVTNGTRGKLFHNPVEVTTGLYINPAGGCRAAVWYRA